jgi:hypothetical protein
MKPIISGVPQGNILVSLLFFTCMNEDWRNIESTVGLFADYCIIYRK